jgi:hypothetical protein
LSDLSAIALIHTVLARSAAINAVDRHVPWLGIGHQNNMLRRLMQRTSVTFRASPSSVINARIDGIT